MNGWIKLHRQIQDCFIWRNNEPFDKRSAWIDLLLLMEHRDKELLIDGKIETVKRGSYMFSIDKLGVRWMWSRNKVKRYLDVLEREQMIVTRRTNKGTLINVVNYCIYQDKSERLEPPNELADELALGRAGEPPHEPPDGRADELQIKNIRNKEYKNIYTVSKDTVRQTDAVRRVIDEWNTLSKCGIAQVERLKSGSNRYAMLVARIKEYGLDSVLKAIDNIRHSKFLQGKSDSKRCWVITFDWFVRPNCFPKVLEGQYNDDDVSGSSQQSITDKQLEALAEKQKADMQGEMLSDDEINRLCEEEG